MGEQSAREEIEQMVANAWLCMDVGGTQDDFESCVDWALSLNNLGVSKDKAIAQAIKDVLFNDNDEETLQ
jgi:hypothetical protein